MADDLIPFGSEASGVEPPIEIANQGPAAVSLQTASTRADKAHFALGESDSPGVDVLRAGMMNGEDSQLRLQANLRERTKLQGVRQEMVAQYIKQGGSDPKEIQKISDDLVRKVGEPETYFERKYAHAQVTQAIGADIIEGAQREDRNLADSILDGAKRAITGKEIAQKVLEELEAEKDKQGWAEFAWDMGETLVPFKSWMTMRASGGDLLLGNNIAQQASIFYSLPPEEQEKWLRDNANIIKSHNLQDALMFVGSIASNASSDVILGNLVSFADIGTAGVSGVAGATSLAARGPRAAAVSVAKNVALSSLPPGAGTAGKATAKLAQAAKDVVKASMARAPEKAQALEAAGDITAAARNLATWKLDMQASGAGSTRGLEAIKKETPSIFAPDHVFGEVYDLSKERANRVLAQLNRNAEKLQKTATDPIAIERMDDAQRKMALSEAEKQLAQQYPHVSDHVLSVAPRTPEEAQLATLRTDITRRADVVQRDLNKRGKIREYNDYLIHSGNVNLAFKRAAELVSENEKLSLQKAARNATRPHFDKTRELENQLDDLSKKINNDEFNRLLADAKKSMDVINKMPKKDRAYYDRVQKVQKASRDLPRGSDKDVSLVRGLGNVDYMSVKLGRTDGTLFESEAGAREYAKDVLGLKDFRVNPQGSGFHIELQKALDETLPTVRNALDFKTDATPQSAVNSLAGTLRSKVYILPEQMSEDFNVSAFGSSYLARVEQEVAGSINSLAMRKEQREKFVKFIEKQRTTDVDGKPGKYSESQGEFEREWLAMHGKLPGEKETIAYWTHVQLSDWDYVTRNLGVYRDKSRLGWEMFSFKAQGFESKKGLFEGKMLQEMPQLKEDAGVLVWSHSHDFQYMKYHGATTFKDEAGLVIEGGATNKVTIKNRELIKKLQGEGYKIVQLTHFGDEALKGYKSVLKNLPDGPVHFVLARDVDSTPLEFQQLPYRAGVHHDYQANVYLRQPTVLDDHLGKRVYYGDKNVHGFKNQKDANKWLDRYETARLKLREAMIGGKDTADYDDFVREKLPMYSPQSFKALFDEGRYDIHTPFMATGANQRTWQTAKFKQQFPNAFDNGQSELNMYREGVNLQYMMERGDPLTTIAQSGSKDNPTFKITDAPMIDALATIDRAGTTLMRGKYLEDVKIKYVERFVQEFGDLLDVSQDKLQNNPFRYIFNTPWKTGLMMDERANAARNYLRSLKEFLHLKSPYEKSIDHLKQTVADGIYTRLGQKAFDQVEPYLYHNASAVDAFRAVAFDAKLGSFNPTQLLLQAQTVVHIAGVEGPIRTIKATPSANYSRILMAMDSPDKLAWAAKKIGEIGDWKADHFVESHTALMRTGFHNVGRETAQLGDFVNQGIITGKTGTFREWGRMFFNEGDRYPRLLAWHAAYDRWRTANPYGKLDDKAISSILARAQVGTNDMSSAATATWQRGIAGIPTQFWAYQTRIFEQMVGGRLTPMEKARVLGMHSLVYGLPVGSGIVTLGYPLGEEIKKMLLERGIDQDDNIATKAIVDGLGSVMIEAVTGGEKMAFGERYGPGGLSFLQDIFSGDKTAFQLLTGASGSTIRDGLTSLAPFAMAVVTAFMPGQDSYPLTTTDFHNVMSNVSTYNAARKAVVAHNLGQYISKHGDVIDKSDKINTVQSLMIGLMGLEPQRIKDMYKVIENNKDLAEVQKNQEKFVVRYFREGIEALHNGDEDLYHRNMTKVKAHLVAGGFREDQKPQIFKRAIGGQETKLQEIQRKYGQQSPEKLEYFMKQTRKREQQ